MTEITSAAQKSRIVYIDILRVLSALAVVFLHTAAGSLWSKSGTTVWHISNILTGIMSISVPIFFMISGAMMMSSSKTLSIGYTYKKRVLKMLVPFLVWSVVAIIYYQTKNVLCGNAVNWRGAAKQLLYIPSQPATVHLWFMYALIPLYLLSPVLKRLVDSMSQNLVKYLFTLWLVFSSILPTIASFLPERYQPIFRLNAEFNLNFVNGYLGYFLLGYYLFIYEKKMSKKLLIGIMAIDTAVISLGTWWKTYETGSYSEIFKTYPRLFMLILSVAAFLLVKEMAADCRLPKLGSDILQVISMTSFGVYLLHNLVVDFVSAFIVNLWPAGSVYTIFVYYIVILAVTLVCIIMLASSRLTCFAFTGMTYKEACQTCNIHYFLNKILVSEKKYEINS